MYLSIVIPFNSLQYTINCIRSVEKYTSDIEHEIICVNNGCNNLLTHRVNYPNLKEISCKKKGFAPSVNRGIMESSGEYIILLNNDTLAGQNWAYNMLKCIEETEGAGVVGPRTNVALASQRIPDIDLGDNSYKIEKFMENFNVYNPEKWYEADFITGFCMLIKREVIEKVGLFDEGYEIGCYEDVDFILRVKMQGYKIMCAGDTFVYHYGHKSLFQTGDIMKTYAIIDRNKQRYYKKWGNIAKEPEV